MNLFDILLALPLIAAAWALLSNGVPIFSIIKALLALGILFAALMFIEFPDDWTDGSFLYAPLKSAVDFILKICGAL